MCNENSPISDKVLCFVTKIRLIPINSDIMPLFEIKKNATTILINCVKYTETVTSMFSINFKIYPISLNPGY